jgi:hypothetical protein
MSYKTTILFDAQTTLASDPLTLSLVFNTNLRDRDVTVQAKDHGILVKQWGVKEDRYDLDDQLLVPGTLDMVIADSQGFIENFVAGSSTVSYSTDKNFYVKILLGSSEEFTGNASVTTIDYNHATGELKFTAISDTTILNRQMLYNESGEAINPFGFAPRSVYNIAYILQQAYRMVDSSITSPDTMEVVHDWTFAGERDTAPYWVYGFEFSDIMQESDDLFFDNRKGISTLGDLLRKLAVDWCAFTGMTTNKRAFFKKLFHYNPSNLQTLGDVLHHSTSYKYDTYDWIKCFGGNGDSNEPYTRGTYTTLQDKFLIRNTLPNFFRDSSGSTFSFSNIKAYAVDFFLFQHPDFTVPPAIGDIYSDTAGNVYRLTMTTLPGGLHAKCYFHVASVPPTGTLTRVIGSGDPEINYTHVDDMTDLNTPYDIYYVRDPSLFSGTYRAHADMEAEFWYQNRCFIDKCRIETFKVVGINYNFLKDFNYNGCKYQPIAMRKDYGGGTTEIDALFLGSL